MSLFDIVSFGPDEIRAVDNGTAPRGAMLSILTSQTCGEPCWHAREEVCRCSCGGRNHGCLTLSGGKRPERTSRIDGHVYRLKSVAMVAKMGALFCQTPKETNDWQVRMLKAGLENRGLSMPADWDNLSEPEKTKRLTGAIAAISH